MRDAGLASSLEQVYMEARYNVKKLNGYLAGNCGTKFFFHFILPLLYFPSVCRALTNAFYQHSHIISFIKIESIPAEFSLQVSVWALKETS